MYASNGQLAGRGIAPGDPSSSYRIADVRGGWTIDKSVRVCTTMRIGGMDLPTRCQAWFKLGDVYYISDSDTDRRGKVLRRELKATSALVAGPDDLGQLLDAGGKRISAAEFKRELVQRTIVGPLATGEAPK